MDGTTMRWRHTLPIVALAALALSGASSAQEPEQAADATRRPGRPTDDDQDARTVTTKPADQDERESEEAKHRGREVWYWVVYTLLTGLVAAGAVIAAWFAKGTFEAADRQAKANEAALVVTTRAWMELDVSLDDGGLTWKDGVPTLQIALGAENEGSSPALRAWFNPVLFVRDFKHSNVAAELRSRCEGLRTPRSYPYPLGVSVFPHRRYEQRTSVGVPASEVVAGVDQFRGKGPLIPPDLMPNLALAVCIDYAVVGDSGHHQTGAVFDLERLSLREPRATVYTPFGKDVPKGDLILLHNFQGDYAD